MDFNRMRFSGNPKNYPVWKMKFMKYASMRGFLTYVNGTEKVSSRTPPEEGTLYPSDVTKISSHDTGYGELLLEMEDDKLSLIVGKAVTVANPSGDLELVWKKLEGKFCKKI